MALPVYGSSGFHAPIVPALRLHPEETPALLVEQSLADTPLRKRAQA